MPNPNAGRTIEEARNTPKPQDLRKENEFVTLWTGGQTRIREKEGAEKRTNTSPWSSATEIANQRNQVQANRWLQINAWQTVQEPGSLRGQTTNKERRAWQVEVAPTQLSQNVSQDLTADEIVAWVREWTLNREQVNNILKGDPNKALLVRSLMPASNRADQIASENRIARYQTPSKMMDGVKNWELTTTDLNYIKDTNPSLYSEYVTEQENALDMASASIIGGWSFESLITNLASIQENFIRESERISTERKSAKEIKDEIMNSAESQRLYDDVTDLDEEIEQLQITIDEIENNVRDEFEGRASESFIQSKIADKTRKQEPKLRRLLAQRENAAADYNNYITNWLNEVQMALDEQEILIAEKRSILKDRLDMTTDVFDKSRDLALNELEQEQQEYRSQKNFDQQLALFEYKEQRWEQATKDFMKREYEWKKSTWQLDKDNVKWFQSDDGIIWLNTETWEFEFNFSPNAVSWFQFDMDIPRTWDNVWVDINNPWNITVRWGDPSTIANYGKQIWAIWTYKSPNGREYYVFSSLEEGSRALRNDLKAKTSGKSAFVKPTDSLARLIKVYSGDSSVDTWYWKSILQSLWLTKEWAALPISYFDPDELSEAFAQADSWIDISWLWYTQSRPIWTEDLPTAVEIRQFNNSTFKPQDLDKWSEKYTRYQKFVEEQNRLAKDPNASLADILYYSQWWTPLTQTQEESLRKYQESFSWIMELTTKILEWKTETDADISPIIWRLQKANPRDVDAQLIESISISVVPGLARWVYWEVGVLTDADVERYKRTLPNLTQPEELRKAVTAMTLNKIINWYKDTLRNLAAWWRKVSGYEGILIQLQSSHEKIMSEIWSEQKTPTSKFDVLYYE